MLDMRRELEEIRLACMAAKMTRAYRVDGLENFSAKPLAAEPFMCAESSLPNKIDIEDYLREKMAKMISSMAAEAKVPCAAAVPFEKMSTEDYFQEKLDKLLAPQAASIDMPCVAQSSLPNKIDTEDYLREKMAKKISPMAAEAKVPCAAAVPFEKVSTEDYFQEKLDKLLDPQAVSSDFLEEILREKEKQFLAPEAREFKLR